MLSHVALSIDLAASFLSTSLARPLMAMAAAPPPALRLRPSPTHGAFRLFPPRPSPLLVARPHGSISLPLRQRLITLNRYLPASAIPRPRSSLLSATSADSVHPVDKVMNGLFRHLAGISKEDRILAIIFCPGIQLPGMGLLDVQVCRSCELPLPPPTTSPDHPECPQSSLGQQCRPFCRSLAGRCSVSLGKTVLLRLN